MPGIKNVLSFSEFGPQSWATFDFFYINNLASFGEFYANSQRHLNEQLFQVVVGWVVGWKMIAENDYGKSSSSHAQLCFSSIRN